MLRLVACDCTVAAFSIFALLAQCRADTLAIHQIEGRYGLTLTSNIRVCSPAIAKRQQRPGVLLIHGGGWMSGTLNQMAEWCTFLVRHGVVAATLDYRLANEDDDSTRWPAQLDDAKAALGWLRSRAPEFDLDPARVCAFGISAGGHIALWLGIVDRELACVVDAAGPTDLTRLKAPRSLGALLGKSNDEDTLRAASPLFNLPEQMPPVLTIHGNSDNIVPPEHSSLLVAELRRRRLAVTEINYAGSHSLGRIDSEMRSLIFQKVLAFIRNSGMRKADELGPSPGSSQNLPQIVR